MLWTLAQQTRWVNHSLEISIWNQKSRTPKPEIPLKKRNLVRWMLKWFTPRTNFFCHFSQCTVWMFPNLDRYCDIKKKRKRGSIIFQRQLIIPYSKINFENMTKSIPFIPYKYELYKYFMPSVIQVKMLLPVGKDFPLSCHVSQHPTSNSHWTHPPDKSRSKGESL